MKQDYDSQFRIITADFFLLYIKQVLPIKRLMIIIRNYPYQRVHKIFLLKNIEIRHFRLKDYIDTFK